MNMENRKKFITNFVFFAIVALILYVTLKYMVGWLMPFIIGFAIAYLMNPMISWVVKKTHIKRHFVASFFTISLAAVLGFIVWFIVYQIIRYGQSYFYLLPNFVNNEFLPALSKVNIWFTNYIEDFSPEMKFQVTKIIVELFNQIQTWAVKFSTDGLIFLTNVTKSLPFMLLTFIFTVLATIFTNIDFPNVKAFILDTMPNKYSVLAKNIKVAFKETVGKYIVAYFKIMTITFIELGIALSILKVPNAIFIAFLIAIFDIMPVLGTGGIIIPWVIFSFIVGDIQMGIGLLITYAVITVIRQIIEPKIVGDQLGLNPLVTLISIYLGFIWFGVAGMFIVPITANITIRLYREDKLTSFINFEELYFDDEEREARIKKKKELQAQKETENDKDK